MQSLEFAPVQKNIYSYANYWDDATGDFLRSNYFSVEQSHVST